MQTNSNHKINIIIVGAGKAGELIAGDILKNKQSPFNIIGFVDDDKNKIDIKVAGVRVIGVIENLKKLIKENNLQIFIERVTYDPTYVRMLELEITQFLDEVTKKVEILRKFK